MKRILFMSAWFLVGSGALAQAERELYFETKVEPLLQAKCFKCHSHDSGKMKGGLTLDSRSGWAVGGDSGPALVPGDPEKSLLILAIRHLDEDLKMPPKEKLSDAEIQILTDWVRAGAYDPRLPKTNPTDWWSLRPLKQPVVPGPGHPIDAFIRAKLKASGLKPSPRADAATLLRRLTVDLHGLAPTPEAAKRFDGTPESVRATVDALLASPRYGERWARHWLDTVHFADSHGCEHDIFRPNAWPYRDYVIDSLNRDTPWPRFIREQLAIDHFFPTDTHLSPALGFLGAGPLELSRAGTAPVTFDYLDRDDMVTQVMGAFASTTVNCARCHNHKFDPISQEDYYSLQAVFAGVGKGDLDYDANPQTAAERARWATLRKPQHPLTSEQASLVAQWEAKRQRKPVTWTLLKPEIYQSAEGATLKRLEDDSVLATGQTPLTDTYTVSAPTELKSVTAIRLDVMPHDSLPFKGPGRAGNGNLHLHHFSVSLFHPDKAEPTHLTIKTATSSWDQSGWVIGHAIDDDPKTGWAIYPKVGEAHHAVFEFSKPAEIKPDTRIVVTMQQLQGGAHLIGRFKLQITDAPGAASRITPDVVLRVLRKPSAERSQTDQTALATYVLDHLADEAGADLPGKTQVYAVSRWFSHAKKNAAPIEPKKVHVLKRGDIHKPGAEALPGALASIDALPGRFELPNPEREGTRRAALADWLAHSDNPLTWRSIVNRVWHYHFGVGLSNTPNDLGRMGEEPSHPELLDWLAVWFRDDAQGSLKELHRLILTSETYQQVSTAVPNEVDQNNRLLWRMNRLRMDAETFRDTVLQASGRINFAMGGPGIQQFTQSKGPQDTPKLDYTAFDWNAPSAARRSIYRVVWRGIADPFMDALDFPDMSIMISKRSDSVSALQSLALYNNDFVLHHSRVLAERIEKETDSFPGQVARTGTLIWGRLPHREEQADFEAYANTHGLAALCRVLLNSNEFLMID